MNETQLVEVMPVEYCPSYYVFDKRIGKRVVKNPRLQIYWCYSFSGNLTKKMLEERISLFKNKKGISIKEISDRYILWQYVDKPQIWLDRAKEKVYVSKETLKVFGRKQCRQQASLVLRILKGTFRDTEHYATFRRISVTCNPNRIGCTKGEREIYFQAVRELFSRRRVIKRTKIYKRYQLPYYTESLEFPSPSQKD